MKTQIKINNNSAVITSDEKDSIIYVNDIDKVQFEKGHVSIISKTGVSGVTPFGSIDSFIVNGQEKIYSGITFNILSKRVQLALEALKQPSVTIGKNIAGSGTVSIATLLMQFVEVDSKLRFEIFESIKLIGRGGLMNGLAVHTERVIEFSGTYENYDIKNTTISGDWEIYVTGKLKMPNLKLVNNTLANAQGVTNYLTGKVSDDARASNYSKIEDEISVYVDRPREIGLSSQAFMSDANLISIEDIGALFTQASGGELFAYDTNIGKVFLDYIPSVEQQMFDKNSTSTLTHLSLKGILTPNDLGGVDDSIMWDNVNILQTAYFNKGVKNEGFDLPLLMTNNPNANFIFVD